MIGLSASVGGLLIYRWSEGSLPQGEQLVVDTHHAAVLCSAGRVLGALGEGQYGLDPANLPMLAAVGGPPYAVDLWFVTTTPRGGLRFGGPAGTLADPVSGVRMEADYTGVFTMRVADPAQFVASLAMGSSSDVEPAVL